MKYNTTNFYILILAMASYWITVSTIYMTLPVYFQVNGFSKTEIGLLITIGTVSGALSSLVLGWLSDYVGRKILLVLSLFIYASSFLMFLFFKGLSFFIMTRIIEGLGAFSPPALSIAIIADVSSREKRGQAMGFYESAAGVGRAIGPIIAGIVLTIASFSAYFIFCFLSVFIGATLVLIWLKDAFVKQYCQLLEPKSNIKHALQIGTTKSTIKTLKTILIFYCSLLLRSIGQTAVSPLLSLFFMERLKISIAEISILFCVQGCWAIILSSVAGRFSDRIGRKKLISMGTLLFSIATISYIHCKNLMQAATIMSLTGVASAFIIPVTNAYLADILASSASSNLSGTAFGISQFLSVQTYSFGSALGGYVVDVFDYSGLFLIASTLSIASLLPLVKVPEPCAKNE